MLIVPKRPGKSLRQGVGATTPSCGMWDLVPWQGTESRPHAMGTQTLSHWTTRKSQSHGWYLVQVFSRQRAPQGQRPWGRRSMSAWHLGGLLWKRGTWLDLRSGKSQGTRWSKACSLWQVSGFYFDLKNDCKFLSLWK